MEIPGYTIVSELGRGGMATVYLARQDRLDRHVALKVMKPLPGVGEDFTSRFIKEGRIIARLQHPNIVTIFDLDSVGDLHYFSMEYLPNGTLADLIARGLSESRAIEITRGVAHALAVAHENGVIHRDIKPQNILFRADGTPVLSDFGIARTAGASAEATTVTAVGMIVGSPRYMSPEQSMSRPVDARADLYSLGCVLYEMLTQVRPYQAEDVFSLAMKHCSAPLPELPPRLARYQGIINRLLAKDPDARFEDTYALLDALAQFEYGSDPITVTDPDAGDATAIATQVLATLPDPPSAKNPLAPAATTDVADAAAPVPPGPRRSKRVVVLGSIAAIVTSALAGGIYWYLPPRTPEPLIEISRKLPPPIPGRSSTIERYEALAMDRLQAGEYQQSLDLVQLALSTQPDDPRLNSLQTLIGDYQAADEQVERARRLLAQDDYSASLAAIEQGLKRVADHPALLRLQQAVSNARDQAQREIAQRHRQLAEKALQSGQPAEAMRHIREGLTTVAGDPALRALEQRVKNALDTEGKVRDILDQATRMVTAGLLEDGLKRINEGLSLAPEDSALRDLRATIEKRMRLDKEGQAEQLQGQAQTLLEQGALEEALATIEQALMLQPDGSSLKETRQAILDARLDQRIQAILASARVALLGKDTENAQNLIASALKLRADDKDALALRALIEQQISADQQVDITVEEVQRLRAAGQLKPALEQLASALERTPANPRLIVLEQEIRAQQTALDQEAAAELAKQASTAYSEGQVDDALALIDQGNALDPDNPELADLRQRINAAQEAKAALSRAMLKCKTLNTDANRTPEAKLTAMQTGVDCLLSLPDNQELNPERIAQLAQIRADLASWAAGQPPATLLPAALELIGQLEAAEPDHPPLRQLRREITKRMGVLPEMVNITGGCFMIGTPKTASPREPDEEQQRVCIDDFAIAATETTQQEFNQFVSATQYRTDAEQGVGDTTGCWSFDQEDAENPWNFRPWANWTQPNKYQKSQDNHPVTCVSANDVGAYLQWLSNITGEPFRLPTEAEWEYAARAATGSPVFWGDPSSKTTCQYANTADTGHGWTGGPPCDDGNEWIAPVKTFSPNAWGLYDMIGNATEWTCSDYQETYRGDENQCASADSLAPRSLRGGAWNSGLSNLRAAYRNRELPATRASFIGFRIARDGRPSEDDAEPTKSTHSTNRDNDAE